MAASPLLVFGPRSETYDFGPSHPLTPRRFGPGIDLLRRLGAEPGLAPEPAPDDELRWCHDARYIEIVRHFSDGDVEPWSGGQAGIGPGDDPPFHGMHEAAAAVAGGSIRAMDAILDGSVEHAFHPGGGLHHAMPGRAAGFCIYDDPALAIARARQAGLRVLYVDLDVHHGDGVEAIHAADPGVLTVSFHESGRYLFPGTGFVGEIGEGEAAGTAVNVPLEPETGEDAWYDAVSRLVPELAVAFAPDVVVSQHGCDTHATDPLAHLNVTTTAMGRAARLVDAIAHRFAGGRWLSTGGGGYGVYRVVPRAWAHVWLAAAHRDAPERMPGAWLERWAHEAARFGDRQLPLTLDDPPNAGLPMTPSQAAAEAASLATLDVARRLAVPALLRVATDRGWWSPFDALGRRVPEVAAAGGVPTTLTNPGRAALERLRFAPRIVGGVDPATLAGLLVAAADVPGGLDVTVAIDADVVVGLAASSPAELGRRDGPAELLALGVAPGARRSGLATTLLRRHLASLPAGEWRTTVTAAERDAIEPIPRADRATVAGLLLEGAGFEVTRAAGEVGRLDPLAVDAIRR